MPLSEKTAVEQTDNPTILVGIDWADENHAFHLVTLDGNVCAGSLDQDPQAIADWIANWQKQFPGCQIEIGLETSRGALINTLREHQLTIYPVNPTALANYRKAFAHGGGKNDPVDAKLIYQFLLHYRNELAAATCKPSAGSCKHSTLRSKAMTTSCTNSSSNIIDSLAWPNCPGLLNPPKPESSPPWVTTNNAMPPPAICKPLPALRH